MRAVAAGIAISVATVWAIAGTRAFAEPPVEPVESVDLEVDVDETARPCLSAEDAHIEIHTADHQLVLCRDKKVEQIFRVRLARAGLGKTKEGDNKVPLGTYPLGEPRASQQFWRFIPIGYPTAEQKRRGLTGGNVGIHGPRRSARWLGSILRWFDTTHGCIALAYDEEMDAIVDWLAETKADRVQIE